MQGYFPAKVINNNDTKQKGRIQIKIDHLHFNIPDKELPWAKQSKAGTGGSDQHGISFIPEKDSFVWVWFEDTDHFRRRPFYSTDVHFSDFHPHGLFDQSVKSAISSNGTYPNVKYIYFPNGICIGVDSSPANKEIFIYHPQAYITINNTGDIKIQGVTLELLGGSVPSEKTVLGETFKDTLDVILDQIIAHAHPYTDTPVGPSVTGPPGNAAIFTTIKTVQVPLILSNTVKNN
jgi:hypothetical protein